MTQQNDRLRKPKGEEAVRAMAAIRKAIEEILACDDPLDMDKLVSHYLGPLRAAGFGIGVLTDDAT